MKTRQAIGRGDRTPRSWIAVGVLVLATLAVVGSRGPSATGSPSIVEYPIGTGSSSRSLVAGSDGALWVLENGLNAIARVTTSGTVTPYTIPTSGSNPGFITEGSDGAVWFSETAGEKIGRLSTSGTFTEYAVPQAQPLKYQNPANPSGVALGSDGAVWFAENGGHAIGRVSTSGDVTAYATLEQPSFPGSVTSGPQGDVWYTEGASNPLTAWKIGEMTTAGLVVHEFPVPDPVFSIAVGPDGSLWFVDPNNNSVDRLDSSGTITAFTVPTANAGVNRLTLGPDGALWFTETTADNVGRITTGGAITEYPVPTPDAGPVAITAGPGGTVWFTERFADKVGCIDTSAGTCAASATTTTSAPPVPVIAVTSSSLAHAGAKLPVGLACRNAACAGTVQFTAKVKVKSPHGSSSTVKTASLASGTFQLAAGARSTVRLVLTAAGRSTFGAAHAIHGTVIVTVKGGATVRRNVVAR